MNPCTLLIIHKNLSGQSILRVGSIFEQQDEISTSCKPHSYPLSQTSRKQEAAFTLGICLSLFLLPAFLPHNEEIITGDANSAVLSGYRATLSAEGF